LRRICAGTTCIGGEFGRPSGRPSQWYCFPRTSSAAADSGLGYFRYVPTGRSFRRALGFSLRSARSLQLFPVFFRLRGVDDAELGNRLGERVA